MTYSFKRILPTPENAGAILGMMADDLQAAGLSEYEVASLVDAGNRRHRERIQANLQMRPERFIGVMAAGGSLIGYSEIGKHRQADQEAYGGPLEGDDMRRILGIVALCVSQSPEYSERLYVARHLLDCTLTEARRYNDTRVGIRDGDPLTGIFHDRGFEPTDLYADPLQGRFKVQLHVRQSLRPNKQ